MDFHVALILILLMALGSFVCLYLLQIIGLEINWTGGREAPKDESKNDESIGKKSIHIRKNKKP